MVNGDAHLLVLGLRISKHLGHIEHTATGHTGAVDDFNPMINALQAGACIDLAIDGAAVFKAQTVVGKFGAVFEVFQAQGGEQLDIKTVVRWGHGDLSIAGFKQTIGRGQGMVIARALRQLTIGKIIGGQKRQHAGHAVGQGGGHLFALTRATFAHQSGQHPHRGIRASDHV